nr:MAG TPA: hypothetical protein [Caudoviricetes sp.]
MLLLLIVIFLSLRRCLLEDFANIVTCFDISK